MNRSLLAMIACGAVLALAGCEKEGKMEKAGEELDEAVETIKQGEEPVSAKIDDAIDEAKEGVEKAAEDVKKD